jgi:hypothetical protein
MVSYSSTSWAKPAIQVAAVGLGNLALGHLGGALAPLLAGVLGGSATALIEKCVEQFGERAAGKILDLGSDSLAERFAESAPPVEAILREALRSSLYEVKGRPGWTEFADWFKIWECCLGTNVPLDLKLIPLAKLELGQLAELFRDTLERLDAQGAEVMCKSTSLRLECRKLPDLFCVQLRECLPEILQEKFRLLISRPDNEAAWKQMEQLFQEAMLEISLSIKSDTTELRADTRDIKTGLGELGDLLHRLIAAAERDNRISAAEARALRAESTAAEWKRKYLELERTSPSLRGLLLDGDLKNATRALEQLKQRLEQSQMIDSLELARTSFELGTLYELQFDGSKALQEYRAAWKLQMIPEYGFTYAKSAAQQNQFPEAAEVYQTLCRMYTQAPQIAGVLNRLGLVYRKSNQIDKAEQAFTNALDMFERLVKDDAYLYEPMVAATQDNMAVLYRETGRFREAGQAFERALALRRMLALKNYKQFVPDMANTLNNLGLLYLDTQEWEMAEDKFSEALAIREELAMRNPEIYLSAYAESLNNMGCLFIRTARGREAANSYLSALTIRLKLAGNDPDAHQGDLAMTLSNLGNLCYLILEKSEALDYYTQSLRIRYNMALTDSDSFTPDLVATQINLTNLFISMERFDDAERMCGEAEKALEPMWQKTPQLYGNLMSRILWNRSDLLERLGKIEEARFAAERAFAAASDPEV